MGSDQSSIKSRGSDVVDAISHPTDSGLSFDAYPGPASPIVGSSGNCEIKNTDSNGNKSRVSDDDPDALNRSTLVVVNSLESEEPSIESDPLFIRINQIPMFLPLLDQQSRKFPWSKPNHEDPTSKLHRTAGTRIGRLYNGYLKKHTQIIANEQTHLTKKIKKVNVGVDTMMKVFTTRQRQHAQHAHKFGQIPEISRTLLKCQNSLRDALKTAELLNDMLPPDDKLPPFVWCADTDVESSCSLNINVKEERPISVSRFSS